MAIKIYGMGPSRSLRVLWAAEEAGLNYSYVELKLRSMEEDGTHNEKYLKINAQGKVPAIEEDGFVLTESAAIVNYFASKVPEKKLVPQYGTQDYARYDEMCFFILSELEQPLWTNGKHMFAIPEEYRVPAIMEKTTTWEFAKAQNAVLKLLDNRAYAVGKHFTMADILLTQTISWAYNFKFDVDNKLLEYKAKIVERPAYIRTREFLKK